MSTLAERYRQLKDRIETATVRSGRPGGCVRLVAVTKYAPLEQVAELVRLGHFSLGESRVQQLRARYAELPRLLGATPKPLEWHMIGHLQRNKVRELLPIAACIHAVDSLRLAQTISDEAQRLGKSVTILLQVNASLEPQKHGASLSEAPSLAEKIAALQGVTLAGLMSMAELTEDAAAVQAAFARTRQLFDTLVPRLGRDSFRELSMGMSHDFELAIQEGATIVRVGSALFSAEAS